MPSFLVWILVRAVVCVKKVFRVLNKKKNFCYTVCT